MTVRRNKYGEPGTPWDHLVVEFEIHADPGPELAAKLEAIDENDLLHPLPDGWKVDDVDERGVSFEVTGTLLVMDGRQVEKLLIDLGLRKKFA